MLSHPKAFLQRGAVHFASPVAAVNPGLHIGRVGFEKFDQFSDGHKQSECGGRSAYLLHRLPPCDCIAPLSPTLESGSASTQSNRNLNFNRPRLPLGMLLEAVAAVCNRLRYVERKAQFERLLRLGVRVELIYPRLHVQHLVGPVTFFAASVTSR